MFILQTLILICLTLVTGNPVKNHGRIVGGEDAPEAAFPYMASIQLEGYNSCGGFIITDRTVVTAAHCVDGLPHDRVTVVVGTNQPSQGGIHYRSSQLKVHESYNVSMTSYDIALIIIHESIQFSNLVQPISIEKQYINEDKKVTLAGWGSTKSFSGNPDMLQYIQLLTITNEACRRSFSAINWQDRLLPSSLCTFTKVGEGACYGDSGSALIYRGKAVGIVSWSYPCARGYPDVYTRLSFFYDWIEENKV